MPNLDKTGPQGNGPTGLRCGNCPDPKTDEKEEVFKEKDEQEVKEEE